MATKKAAKKPKRRLPSPPHKRPTTKRITYSKGQLPRDMTEYRPKKTVLARHIDEPFGVKGGRKTIKNGYLVLHPNGRLAAVPANEFIEDYEVIPVGESEVND